MKYYTSDLHFNHTNILNFCKRPFKDVQEMNSEIIKRWNNKVNPKDDIYILGDFCFGNKNEAQHFLSLLNGNKYLIRGNHDGFLNRNSNEFPGFVWVRTLTEIKDEGRDVILCHYPIESWNKKFHDSYHLYGHVHNSEIVQKIPNRFNVGVDVNDFEPKTLDELIEINKD